MATVTAHFYELLTLFFIILTHELGHALTAHYFSWRIKKVLLLPFGGVAEMDEHGNRPLMEEFYVTIAGPFQHVILMVITFLLFESNIISPSFFTMFTQFNVMILIFNLLPIWPLDGGKLLQLALSTRLPFLIAYRLCLLCSFVFLIGLHVIVLLFAPTQLSIWIVLIYLYFSLWFDWKQVRYVFMRFLLERYYGKKTNLSQLKPVYVDVGDMVSDVLEKFQRGYKHPLIISRHGEEIGKLDENEVLYACFAQRKLTAQVKDILYNV